MKNIIRLLCLMFAALMIMGAFAACGKVPVEGDETVETDPTDTSDVAVDADDGKYEEDKAEYDAMTAEQLVEKYVADPANITIQEYANLIATYAFLSVENGDFDYTGTKTNDALNIIKDAGSTLPKPNAEGLAKEMVAKPYANSRAYYYISLANFIVADDTEDYNALLEQYKKETDPFVVASVIRGLANTFAYDVDFCKYALSYVESDNYEAKLRLTSALPKLRGVDGEEIVNAALKLLEDKEGNIAFFMAEECGFIGDDRFVEPIKAVIAGTEDPGQQSYGVKGLIRMWYGSKTSEAAYNATMEYFKAESTDPRYPSWDSVALLSAVHSASYDKWRAEATYFNERELVEVMKALVADAEAQRLTKINAVKVIGVHGTAADLNSLRPLVESSIDKDKIIAEIDKQLANK